METSQPETSSSAQVEIITPGPSNGKLKKVWRRKFNTEPWTPREHLALLRTVRAQPDTKGLTDWSEVSQFLASDELQLREEKNRAKDWYAPEICAREYDFVINEFGTRLPEIAKDENKRERAERFLETESNRLESEQSEKNRLEGERLQAKIKELKSIGTHRLLPMWEKELVGEMNNLICEEVEDDGQPIPLHQSIKKIFMENIKSTEPGQVRSPTKSLAVFRALKDLYINQLKKPGGTGMGPIFDRIVTMQPRPGVKHAENVEVEIASCDDEMEVESVVDPPISSGSTSPVKDIVSETPASAIGLADLKQTIPVSSDLELNQLLGLEEAQEVDSDNTQMQTEVLESNETETDDQEVHLVLEVKVENLVDTDFKKSSEEESETQQAISSEENPEPEEPVDELGFILETIASTEGVAATELVLEEPKPVPLVPKTRDLKQEEIIQPKIEIKEELEDIKPIMTVAVPSVPSTSVSSIVTRQAAKSVMTEEEHKIFKKSMHLLHERIVGHKNASLFHKPIKEENAPGYYRCILEPMDLSTIKKRIDSGEIRSIVQYERDISLMMCNAIMFNSKNDPIVELTQEMLRDVNDLIADYKSTQELVQSQINAESGGGPSDKVETPPIVRRTRRRDSSMTLAEKPTPKMTRNRKRISERVDEPEPEKIEVKTEIKSEPEPTVPTPLANKKSRGSRRGSTSGTTTPVAASGRDLRAGLRTSIVALHDVVTTGSYNPPTPASSVAEKEEEEDEPNHSEEKEEIKPTKRGKGRKSGVVEVPPSEEEEVEVKKPAQRRKSRRAI